jgi:predicted NUDIX family NTP pyrophosphohydrolase
MSKRSAGILLYRFQNGTLQVLLVHPGGPFWVKKDNGAWSIPKGEIEENENPFAAAKREAFEETGINLETINASSLIELNPVKTKSGKIIFTWAAEGNFDANKIKSNLFEIEWPPRSGLQQQFPEVNKAGWFSIEEAKSKVSNGQVSILEELAEKIGFR